MARRSIRVAHRPVGVSLMNRYMGRLARGADLLADRYLLGGGIEIPAYRFASCIFLEFPIVIYGEFRLIRPLLWGISLLYLGKRKLYDYRNDRYLDMMFTRAFRFDPQLAVLIRWYDIDRP